MKIWRVQHHCAAPHGPLQPCRDETSAAYCDWTDVPRYGSNLECPNDTSSGLAHLNLNYMGEYIFGTLPEQFPRWWSHRGIRWNDETDEAEEYVREAILQNDWYAVLYEVEDGAFVIGTNQVIFDSYRAVEILRTQTDFPR